MTVSVEPRSDRSARVAVIEKTPNLTRLSEPSPTPPRKDSAQLELGTINVGKTHLKHTAVEVGYKVSGNVAIVAMANAGALVFYPSKLSDADVLAHQDDMLASLLSRDLKDSSASTSGRFGFVLVPNIPGPAAERLQKERQNILDAKMYLYVLSAFKYRDAAMSRNTVRITEWGLEFNGPVNFFVERGRNRSTVRKVDNP